MLQTSGRSNHFKVLPIFDGKMGLIEDGRNVPMVISCFCETYQSPYFQTRVSRELARSLNSAGMEYASTVAVLAAQGTYTNSFRFKSASAKSSATPPDLRNSRANFSSSTVGFRANVIW